MRGAAMLEEIERLLKRGWDAMGLEPPLLSQGDLEMVSRRAFLEADLAPGSDPKLVAARLGLRIVRAPWLSSCGGEVTDGLTLAYRPHPIPQVESARVAHGLAHALLRLERWSHTETDVKLLSGFLLLNCPN